MSAPAPGAAPDSPRARAAASPSASARHAAAGTTKLACRHGRGTRRPQGGLPWPTYNARVALRAIEARRVGSAPLTPDTAPFTTRALRSASLRGLPGLDWRAVAVVASDKGRLHRVLREKGAVIDSEGHAALRRLPGTFREWISMPAARRFKVGHSAILGVVVGRTAPAPERSRDWAKNTA